MDKFDINKGLKALNLSIEDLKMKINNNLDMVYENSEEIELLNEKKVLDQLQNKIKKLIK